MKITELPMKGISVFSLLRASIFTIWIAMILSEKTVWKRYIIMQKMIN